MWRFYDPEKYPGDEESVRALHAKMEGRIGRKLDLPDLAVAPVIAAVVREIDGKIKHCIFLEAEVEACAIGEEPLAPEDAEEAIEKFLLPAARRYHIRLVRSFVPASIVAGKRKGKSGPVPRLLRKLGFTQETGAVVQFFRWLVPPSDRGKQGPNG